MEDVATTERSSAARMRRYHERRRNGLRTVSVDVHDSEIEFLVRKGFLNPNARHDRTALGAALRNFLEDAFDRACRRGKLGDISVELGQSEIEHLVRKRRLAPEARRDPDAILAAFSDIVHEAFGRL